MLYFILLCLSIGTAVVSNVMKCKRICVVCFVIAILSFLLFILNFFHIDIHPYWKIAYFLIAISILVIGLCYSLRQNFSGILIGTGICIVLLFIACFISPAIQNVSRNGVNYVCVYSKFTGVVETEVFYYQKYNALFIDKECAFTLNYGRVLDDWKEVLNQECYSIKYCK